MEKSEEKLPSRPVKSQARIQTPWVKVTIGDYTFGIFDDILIKNKQSIKKTCIC